jgi:FkbM family methyltransferase
MKHKIKFQVPQLERAFDMGDPSGQDLVFLQVVKEGLHHYEPPLPMLVVSYLSRYQGTFIDVGANTGLYSLIAAAVSEDVNVVAFEPLPQIYAKLVENIRLNEAFARRTRTSPVALSRRTGTLDFYETINDMGYLSTSSTLEENHARAIGAKFVRQKVSAMTLDDWVAENPIKNLSMIKIDAEGHEPAVLEGGIATISSHRPLIAVELLAGSEFDFFREFLRRQNYLNFELEVDCVRQEPVASFSAKSWNHLLCPVEKVYQFLAAARAIRLEII